MCSDTQTNSSDNMLEINTAEKRTLKIIFSDYTKDYNANTIKDKTGVSDVYSLKLLKGLSKKNILQGKKMGKSTFYRTNVDSNLVIKLLELIYTDNTDRPIYIKGWIKELETFKPKTKAILLFGSILTKGKNAQDVDVCFVVHHYDNYKNIERKIQELNKINKLTIHPLYITEKDFTKKLKEGDDSLLDVVRTCAVVHGSEIFVRIVKNGQS